MLLILLNTALIKKSFIFSYFAAVNSINVIIIASFQTRLLLLFDCYEQLA